MLHIAYKLSLLIAISSVLAACANTSAGQQTLIAHDAGLATDRAILQTTATADIAQMMTTLDASELRLLRAEEQRGRILSTLEARGISVEFATAAQAVDGSGGSSMAILPGATPTINPSQTLRAGAAGIPTGATAVPTDVLVTPFRPSDTPTQAPPTVAPISATNLSDVVVAAGVRDDDCAGAITSQFTTDTAEIYVVALAREITPGTRLSSQWQTRGGDQLAVFDFVPNFSIDGECIWFFATPDDFPFNPGDYFVTLLVDGQVASNPVQFSIGVPVTPGAAAPSNLTATPTIASG